MSNFISTEPRPQAPQEPQAAPDRNAIASLILGIVGVTVLPFISSIVAVILGRISIGDAYKRGERGSAIATAGVILGWIGVAAPVVLVAILFSAGLVSWWLALALPALVIASIIYYFRYYRRRNNRR